MSEAARLADQLTALGYFAIFQQEDADTLALADNPAARRHLAQLVADTHADALARFLAAELLFEKDAGFPASANKAELGSVYAAALRDNFTETANTWGLPGLKFGLVGQHVVLLGPDIVPSFRPLLDDDTPLEYEGSEEASIGHTYRFRVKDEAAALIAAVKNLPFAMEQDIARRDATIRSINDATAQ